MHTLTLSFPTLAEMHDALSKLAGRAESAIVADVKAAEVAVVKAVTGKSKPAAAPATPPASPAPAAAASAPAPSASAPAVSAPKGDVAVDYPTLQKAVFKLAGIATGGRDAATALLEQFKVKTFKDLASERWAEALAAVEGKVAELSVPA